MSDKKTDKKEKKSKSKSKSKSSRDSSKHKEKRDKSSKKQDKKNANKKKDANQNNNNIIAEEEGGALDILLHPLVIINISDHYTRQKMRTEEENPRVIGALIGEQHGRTVEVYNSFELITTEEDANKIQMDYLEQKSEQLKLVYPNYDFLGWYSTGERVSKEDLDIHKQFITKNESPLYLMLSPHPKPNARELPLSLYESEMKEVDGAPTMRLTKVRYRIQSGEAERIAVDHIATNEGGNVGGISMLTSHLSGLHSAIKMLHLRILICLEYLKQAKKGKLAKDAGIMRQISALCNLLPTIDTQMFEQDFTNEYNDALLLTYLAGITKTANTVNDLIDKFNITYDRHSRRRGIW